MIECWIGYVNFRLLPTPGVSIAAVFRLTLSTKLCRLGC